MAKYDWETIREFYIAGQVDPVTGTNSEWSLRDICKTFHIKSPQTVKLHMDKENWKADRALYKKRQNETIRQEMKTQELPSLVELRMMLMKVHLGIIKKGLRDIVKDAIDVRGTDIHNSSKFLIDQYHFVFGIPEEQKPAQDINLHIDFEDEDDLYSAARDFLRSNTNKK